MCVWLVYDGQAESLGLIHPHIYASTCAYMCIHVHRRTHSVICTLYTHMHRYFYAVIGMEAFHEHEITFDTPTADHFLYDCGLGFIDFHCSLYMLFQLLTTSNWHDIMNTVRLSVCTFARCISGSASPLPRPDYPLINWLSLHLIWGCPPPV